MNTFEEYGILDAQIKHLELQKAGLRDKIIAEMIEKGEKKSETGVGSFTISMLKTWKYTSKVEELSEKLKATKAKEESCGDATFTEKESLRFVAIKL